MKIFGINILFILTAFFFLYQSSQLSAQPEFIPGFEDVPVMQGMIWSGDRSFSFDSPEGSVVTAEFKTRNPVEDVLKYYDDTLKNLGWIRDRSGNYRRGVDVLLMNISKKSDFSVVRLKQLPLKAYRNLHRRGN